MLQVLPNPAGEVTSAGLDYICITEFGKKESCRQVSNSL